MASTNFLVFDEGKQNMMSDGDYSANTQRARGVTPGIAYPNLHNKLYYQVSVMAKAIADFMVAQGANASDEDVEQLTDDISNAFTNFVDNQTKDVYLPLSGGTMKGNINANGYNITATKFIGNLQGKADSATNADLATKANQDSQGQTINTTYIKSITASNATLTLTKGNGTTSTVTINNVGNSTKATQDKNGKDITGYLYKTEDLTLNSNAEILTVGNISEILNSFCTKFKNIQGTASYGENSPTTLKLLNDNKAPKASPAFSGSPTTPTPSASDNSTKIPNTSWVQTWVKSFINNLSGNLQVTWDGNKYTIPSLGITGLSDINNGYISFGKLFGGLILQYGVTNSYLGNYPYAACNVNFPINFTKNYIIFAMHSGTQPVMINELYTSHTLSKTVLEAIACDGSKSPNWIINWVAIGY